MELTTRRATVADVPFIVANNVAMAAETEDKPLDSTVVTRGVTRLVEDGTQGHYLVAEADGEAVGQLMVTYEWSDWRDGTFWWIQSVYVLPGHRRRGVFRALYGAIAEAARRDPLVVGLRLYVHDSNKSAMAVYERLGMERTAYALYEHELGGGA